MISGFRVLDVRFLVLVCLALTLSVMGLSLSAQPPLANDSRIEVAIEAVRPALVRVFVAEVDYSEGREVKSEAAGSGVIVSPDGYVVTNHHVAGNAKRIFCTLANKEQVDADLVGTDPLTDVAVIKLRSSGPRQFPTAEWGDSSKVKVGDTVYAMGSPLALSQSVTSGIVSNTEMIIPEFLGADLRLDGEDVGSIVRWIGHDAAIKPGNSGGPLVNTEGRIIGINEISLGLAGAIPSNLVRSVAEQIIKNGKVTRAWLGMSVQPLLKSSGLKTGVLVAGVLPDSPAKAAGIMPGDVLVKIAGRDVSVRFSEEIPLFNQMAADLPIGQEVEAIVLRAGKEVPVKIKPQERPEAEPRQREFKTWGMCASNISFVEARKMRRASQDGVLVRSCRPGGPADDAKPSLQESDVILEVAGKPIKNVEQLAALTQEILKGKTEPTPVLVAFDRDSERLVTVVKIGMKDLEDPGREVKKAYLPIASQVLTRDIAEALGVKGRTGVRVTKVYPNTSAQKANLKVGDLIVALDGQEIPATNPEDVEVLPTMIRQYKIGSTVKLTVIRNGKEIQVPVVLEESRPLPREMRRYIDDIFEFEVRDIAFQDRVDLNIDKDVSGVYVESVAEGGWAALGRLSAGDIIIEIDGRPAADVLAVKAAMQKIAAEKPKFVVIKVIRDNDERFIELETDWQNGK